ncbi:MAG: hypothetical protein ACFFED_15080, partial [Candidatus Thorarchaeota archaeon]
MTLNIVTFFSPIASPLFLVTHLEKLRESGARILSAQDFHDDLKSGRDVLHQRNILYIATGGTERRVAEFVHDTGLESPIVLLSHPQQNSLPAAMEIRTYLKQHGAESIIVHDPLAKLIERITRWQIYATHLDNIRGRRLGLIGKPSSWLIASNIDVDAVREVWGIEILEYDLAVLESITTNSEISGVYASYRDNATDVAIPVEELKKASQVAELLHTHIKEQQLDAVSVQCFDFLMKTKISGCLALCNANNEGFPAGCEGDVPTTISMMIARELTASPSFMVNVTNVDTSSNSAVFAHCTVPTSMVRSYDLLTHFESDLSVGIRGEFEEQP